MGLPGQPHTKHLAQATVDDRASDRDGAPKASLTVASKVLHFPLAASGKRPQRRKAKGEDISSLG